MKNTSLTITVPHLFLPISAKSRSYIIKSRSKSHETLLFVFIFMLSLLVIPTEIFGWEESKKAEEELERNTDFDLLIKDGNITLSANAASLKEILKEIGSKMKVEVVGYIPEEEEVSVGFANLSIKETLEKLGLNYGCIKDTEGEKDLVKIIILPVGKETMPYRSTSKDFVIQEGDG